MESMIGSRGRRRLRRLGRLLLPLLVWGVLLLVVSVVLVLSRDEAKARLWFR
jgi:hypothetical protein